MRKLLGGVFLMVVLFAACEKPQDAGHPFQEVSLGNFAHWQDRSLRLSNRRIRLYIDSLRLKERDTTFIDMSCNKYYAARNPYLWINRLGTDLRADTVLSWLREVDTIGVPAHRVYLEKIRENLVRLRKYDFDDSHNANRTLASLEYYLTKAFLRYSGGQRFGFTSPRKILNRLDYEDEGNPKSYFRQLYDIPVESVGQDFVDEAISAVREENVQAFLEQAQPQGELYRRLVHEYNVGGLDQQQRKTLAVNIERARWRQKDQRPRRWVFINIPAQQLVAYDEPNDSMLTMKVCYGSRAHKSPLLVSRMGWLELNPYWVVPHSIVRREIVPNHIHDTDYFYRNRYKIIDKETGDFVEPEDVDAEMLLSGRYRVRQDKGDDNSLGRMIFRFPNEFSIYLHDTNNKAAFGRASRALSHGCIRLEKPMALAEFLLREKDDEFLEKLHEAVERPLEDPEENAAGPKSVMKRCSFDGPIGVYIDYYTCYPAAKGGKIEFYPDVYGYDAAIAKRLLQ